MLWDRKQIVKQALRTAPEDYAAFEAVGLAGRSGVRVLDVGCFDGFNTRLKFAPYAGVDRVVGIDPSPDAIARARTETDDERFSFSCTTLDAFDVGEEACFDLVYFSHTLQYLPDPLAALQRVFRLLAPGGFVIVKTADDAVKLSYPDPDEVMHRLFVFYEQQVLPHAPHAAYADRYQGQKCYSFMKRARFDNVAVRLFSNDTVGKDREERRALFERCVCFQRNVPACVDRAVADEMRSLVEAWAALFEQEDYYFCSQSFVAIAQKLSEGAPPWNYKGPVFGGAGEMGEGGFCETAADRDLLGKSGVAADAGSQVHVEGDVRAPIIVRPLVESDLGGVMGVEIASFRDPWTPLAFALDLRHNARAYYEVALCEGRVVGYVGWWDVPDGAVIVRIAVDPAQRGTGVGRALTERVAQDAYKRGSTALFLEVRAANKGARAFYEHLGFVESYMRSCYYEDPPDDGVVMVRSLS